MSSASQLAVAKGPMLALLTNAGGSSSPSWSIPSTNYTKGEELIDALSCTTTKAGENGAVSWTSASGMPAVRPPFVCSVCRLTDGQVLLPSSVFNATYCDLLKTDASGDAGTPWVTQSSGMGRALSTIGALVVTSLSVLFLVTWVG